MDANLNETKNYDVVEVSPMDSEVITLVGELSREGSISSMIEDVPTPTTGAKSKRKRKGSPKKDQLDEESDTDYVTKVHPHMEQLRYERAELEAFLFTDSNKVNKLAIKFILNKWTALESKVQDLIIENKKLENKLTAMELSPPSPPAPSVSYAQVVFSGIHPHPSGSGSAPATKRKVITPKPNDIFLIKPVKDDDGRTEGELRTCFTRHLEPFRRKLKFENVRQTRQKGLLVEVDSKVDIDIIKQVMLDKIGLKAEEPRKINPSIIIYDVEKDHPVENLKQDFVGKNLTYANDAELEQLLKSVEFRTKSTSKSGRTN